MSMPESDLFCLFVPTGGGGLLSYLAPLRSRQFLRTSFAAFQAAEPTESDRGRVLLRPRLYGEGVNNVLNELVIVLRVLVDA